ncbi:unnamed protein product, partial [marine sediment metagenome]
SEADVSRAKNLATLFTTTHHNQIGLFVEPDIDSNYRAIDSTNFTFTNINAPDLIDPNNNTNVEFFLKDIFFNYIFEKQNYDGSYSDIAGLGNMFSTYMAIETLKIANISYLERRVQLGETDNIANYLISSLNGGGWGFRDNQYLNDSDIISTFSAIELAYSISEIPIIINKKVGEFINSTWSLGSYRLTNNSLIITPETTFYGVRAYLG